MQGELNLDNEENNVALPIGKTRNCNHCNNAYPFTLASSKYCSDKCRVAANEKRKRENPGEAVLVEKNESVAVKQKPELPGLPPAAQYIINHLEKENARWEKKYDEERAERKKLKDKYEALKSEQVEAQHKQTLQGIENAAPTFIEKLMSQLPAPLVEKLGDKILGYIPDAQPAMAGTNGQLEGEPGAWLNGMVQWFSSLPKESQLVSAGLVGELTKVPADQLKDVITRMINILQNGTTIDQPKKQQRSAYGGI